MTDGTGLVWDLSPATAQSPKAADNKQLTAWWADLLSEDASRAYKAVWNMSDVSPEFIVPFLGRHLRPESPPEAAKLRQLISDLNSDTFRVREKAARELQDFGHTAVPALRKALQDKPSPEAARQIEQLLAKKTDIAKRPELLRRLRAMQILERVATKEARAVLSTLAKGLPLVPETKEAQAALARFSP
jgi:hypothetical protein